MGKNKAGRIIEVLNQELTYMMLLFTLQVERSGEKAELFAWYGTLKMPPLHSKLEVSKHRREKNPLYI